MDPTASPPLRYLSAAAVTAAMPEVEERLALARLTMEALTGNAEMPPKIGVHPRPAAAFAHAMPAWLRGSREDGTSDLLGMKWVAGFPSNAELGLPAIHGAVILNDALTGLPRAILDAAPITAQRTAAVSGLAVRHWGPRSASRPAVVTLLGAGAQGHSHLEVLAHVMGQADLRIFDVDPSRAKALADRAAELGLASARPAKDALAAVGGSDLVITMVSFGPERQILPADAFAPGATVIAVDYDMSVPATVAREAALFLVDEREQYLANRSGVVFAGYPEPDSTIGRALIDGLPRPEGRVLVTHLGVGLADVIFGDAILRIAEERGIGVLLER